jgi:hypothetical protein
MPNLFKRLLFESQYDESRTVTNTNARNRPSKRQTAKHLRMTRNFDSNDIQEWDVIKSHLRVSSDEETQDQEQVDVEINIEDHLNGSGSGSGKAPGEMMDVD